MTEAIHRHWRTRPLSELLAEHDLDLLPEHDFPTDGWSGARFSLIERDDRRFVLKRTSPRVDWIAVATRDDQTREACVVELGASAGWPPPLPTTGLGAAVDGDLVAILMPDLSMELLAWERPVHDAAIDPDVIHRVLDRLAALHAVPWPEEADRRWDASGFPWCPLAERLTLTSRPACARHIAGGIPAGISSAEKLLAGWDAFDRHAPPAARDLVETLSADVSPLIDALGRLPSVGLHGDLKLANVAVLPGDDIRFIDWAMTIRAPVAVELGWFLVSNSASLPERPAQLLDRYRQSVGWFAGSATAVDAPFDSSAALGDWEAQVDLTRIVGLLLRGWRKGLDTEAGATLGSGVSGADDLAEWCATAVQAAHRRL
jgi:hypothetical protein